MPNSPVEAVAEEDYDPLYAIPVSTTEQRTFDQSRMNAFIADVKVNGLPLRLLIDTGSHVSILSEKLFVNLTLIARSGCIRRPGDLRITCKEQSLSWGVFFWADGF